MHRKLRRLWVLSISLTTSLTLSLSAQAQTPDFSFLGSLASKIDASMNQCPERVWPNYNWKEHNIISYEGPDKVLIWRGNTGEVSRISAETIRPLIKQSLYTFANYENKKSVVINMTVQNATQMGIYRILDIILHEGFHSFAQHNWSRAEGSRGTVYPLQARPRLVRRMLYLNLKDYFLSSGADPQALAKAAHWFQEWKKIAPEEVASSMDTLEGTAKYVGVIATSLAGLTCQLPEAELFTRTQAYVANAMGSSVSGKKFSLDSEGYEIGGIAAMILRFIKKDSTWHAEVAKGKSPPEILLSGVTPQNDSISAEDETKFQSFTDLMNETYATALGDSLFEYKNKNFARVVLAHGTHPGSFSPMAFILSREFPSLQLTPMADEMSFAEKGKSLTAAAETVYFSDRTPCARGYQWVSVPLSDLENVNGEVKIFSAAIKGQVPAKHSVDADGIHWFCTFE